MKNRVNPVIELLLCIFLGYFGVHRFYAGKKKSGLVYLFTFGLFGLGWILDIILISARCYRAQDRSHTVKKQMPSSTTRQHTAHSKKLVIPNEYIVFDIETTGFSRNDDRIIEIAANKYRNGQLADQFHSYVYPERHIPNMITRLTGIADTDVSDAPTIIQIKHDLLHFFGNTPLVGHNINAFDIPFLEAQLNCRIENERIDTLHIARDVFPGLPNYKLFTLDQILQLGGGEHHRAHRDIVVNNALLHACASPKQYKQRISDPHVLGNIIGEDRPHPYQKIDIHSIHPSDPCNIPDTALTGHSIVFSGEFSRLPEEMYQIAVDAGAILKNQVSRKVSYLVQGYVDERFLDENGMSNKQRTANKLLEEGHSIQIITETDFLKLAGK